MGGRGYYGVKGNNKADMQTKPRFLGYLPHGQTTTRAKRFKDPKRGLSLLANMTTSFLDPLEESFGRLKVSGQHPPGHEGGQRTPYPSQPISSTPPRPPLVALTPCLGLEHLFRRSMQSRKALSLFRPGTDSSPRMVQGGYARSPAPE